MQPGICYQIDSDENDIYRVQDVNGSELKKFTNFSAYPKIISVPEAFCKSSSRRYDLCADYQISIKQPDGTSKTYTPITQAHILYPDAITLSRDQSLRSVGFLQDVIPTKYTIGYPLTFGTAFGSPDEGFEKLVGSDSFVQLKSLYGSLTSEFNDNLNSCDRRTRIEYQYEIKPSVDTWGDATFLSLKNEIWGFEDGRNVVVGSTHELFNESAVINSIGCSTTLQRFIDTHKQDIEKLNNLTDKTNTLLEQLKKEYPNGEQLDSVDIMKRSSILMADATTSIAVYAATASIETTLDQPTPEQKKEIFLNSGGVLAKIYICLPIFALIGMVAFLFKKFWK